MACEDTLKIKNLPKELTDVEKEEFLKHFGAIKVKVITSAAKQKSVVYAKFDTKELAKEVLYRLHQTFILKNRLCVEYADQEIGPPKIKKIEETSSSNNEHFKAFINKLNAFNHSVDFQQPPPPHLKYVYPKANRLTINNIGHALATVPKFYTQVLHLMNRMNLPPPFAVPEPARKPPVPQSIAQQQQQRNVASPSTSTPAASKQKEESSSESELESDEDSKQQNPTIIPQKRTLSQKKTIKRPKFIKPNIVSSSSSKPGERVEDVFEKNDVQIQRRIELKVDSTVLEQQKSDEQNQEIGVIESHDNPPPAPTASSTITTTTTTDVEMEKAAITEEELNANRIPEKDLDVLPVFKNYHPGVPTARLYIKNIAKTVELKDLEYIYNRYKVDGEETIFDIRLMQEGRMKGQAFITLNSVEIAQKALKETNAYILKDKPLVVVFAKTAPVKK